MAVAPLSICSTIQSHWHCNNDKLLFFCFFSSNPKSRRPFPTHILQLSLLNPNPSSISISISSSRRPPLLLLPVCRAAKSQSGAAPASKRLTSSEPSSANSQKKKKTKRKKKKKSPTFADTLDDGDDDVKIVSNVNGIVDDDDYQDSNLNSKSLSLSHQQHPPSMPLPKPPAGFVVDDTGRVLMASTKRIATIVDPSNNSPLECVIRRVFRSSRGDECMLLCPVDTPVQILKSTNIDGWSAVSDEEVEGILPAVAYALAKIHMHLVHSGFCYTARGRFCYSEDDIFDFRTDDGEDIEGMPAEGVEITCFHLDGAHYMVYTPSDPLLFVAVKDKNGLLQIVDDDLSEDPAIISVIDEETEFNALVEEEAALLESLMGERYGGID